MILYLVMSNVAFSPTFMVVTPSSHPVVKVISVLFEGVSWSSVEGRQGGHTLDDSANADFCDEGSAAN